MLYLDKIIYYLALECKKKVSVNYVVVQKLGELLALNFEL